MRKTLAAVAVLSVAGLGACSYFNDTSRGLQDAPLDRGDRSPAHIIAFPDEYVNVAFKCNGGVGIYVSADSGPVSLLADDPNCSR